MMSADKVAAGAAVHQELKCAEAAHPNSLALHRLHRRLAGLRDAFADELSPEDFEAFGGGTPKTDDGEG